MATPPPAALARGILGNRRHLGGGKPPALGFGYVGGSLPSVEDWLFGPSWAGPTLVGTTPTAITAFSGTHTYTLPTVAVGDRLVLIEGMLSPLASNTPITDMSDWDSFLASEINAFQSWRGYTLHIADAAMVTIWSGATVSFDSANGGKGSALVGRIAEGTAGGLDTGFDVSALSAVTFSAAPNSPSLTPAWGAEDTLWVTIYCAGSTGSTLNVAPNDYGNAVAASSASTVVIGWAWRQLNSATEDPGAFTIADDPPPGDGGENWQAITLAFRKFTPGGTTFPIDLAGATTSTGLLTRRPGKALASALTSAGALTRRPSKALAGAMVSAGVLTATRAVLRTFTGAFTSNGTLTRLTGKPVAGTTTSTGALTRRTGKNVTAAMASSGALTVVKAVLRSFTGAMTSTGALTRQARKPLAGTTTSTGLLTRRPGKTLTGVLTSSGVVSTARVVLLALAGAMASAGTLARRTGKAVTGTSSSTGALTRRPGKTLAGALTSSGTLTRSRLVLLALSGAMTSTGTLVRRTTKTMTGTVTSTGALTRRAAKTLTGLINSVGDLAAILIGVATPATGRRRARTGEPRHQAHPGVTRYEAQADATRHRTRPGPARFDTTTPNVPRHRTRPKRS